MRATPESEQYLRIIRKILGSKITTNTVLVFSNFGNPNNQFNGYLQQRMQSNDSVGSLIADAHSNCRNTNFDNCFLLDDNGVNMDQRKQQLVTRLVGFTPNIISFENQFPWKKVFIMGAAIVVPILLYKTFKCKYICYSQ